MSEKQATEIDKSLRELYTKGKLAYERNNLDYAITLFQSVLKKEPGFYDCREALRATQFKKQGGGTSFFRKVLGSAGSSPQLAKAQIAVRTQPADALDFAESVLNGDPNSIAAHKVLASAAMKLEMFRTAVLSLELAYKNAPKDKEIGLKFGEALIAANQTAKAENMLKELAAEHPRDPELHQAYKDASAKHTMREGKYDSAESGDGSYRDSLRDKDQAVRLEQEQRQVKTDDVADQLIEDLLGQLETNPENIKVLQKIAELYTQKGDLEQAGAYYQQLLDNSEGTPDATIQKAIDDLKTKGIDQQIEALDPEDPEFDSIKDSLETQKHTIIFENCKARSDRYPNDLAIKFELGVLHYERAEYKEAIQLFQKSQANPHIRINALHYLGRCFLQRGILDLAIRPIQNAINEKEIFDEQRKDLTYDLGLIYEKMNKPEEAIEQYKQIYEVDIDFKDVSDKVDAYYANL